jgi:hypothetical protein
MKQPTPGPWKVEIRNDPEFDRLTGIRLDDNTLSSVIAKNGAIIFAVSKMVNKDSEANAYLCAAAPDMFAEIENALAAFRPNECNCDGEYIDGREVGYPCYFHRIEEHLRRAIAKAKVKE